MFSGFMINAWIVSSLVAVVAGLVGFFVVLRGRAFAAHAIPQGAFAGAAGASLLGLSTLLGLGVFAALAALGIGRLSRRGRPDVVVALVLVLLQAIGALFLSWSTQYEPQTFALLFGQVLGVNGDEVGPTALLAAASVAAVVTLFRPLLLSSVMPAVAEAGGLRTGWIEAAFLLVVALSTTLTLPVVGALLIFSLMIGPPAAARSLAADPVVAAALSVLVALLVVWAAIAGAYHWDKPVGFFVGVLSAACYVVGRAWARLAPRARRYSAVSASAG